MENINNLKNYGFLWELKNKGRNVIIILSLFEFLWFKSFVLKVKGIYLNWNYIDCL